MSNFSRIGANVAHWQQIPPRPLKKAKGGAPKGNRNALKHGRRINPRLALRRIRDYLTDTARMLVLADEGLLEQLVREAERRDRSRQGKCA